MSKKNISSSKNSDRGINTRLAHAGNKPHDYHGFVNPPVFRASTILFPDYATMRDGAQDYTYGTEGTPTTHALCLALDELEGSAGTALAPSGLASISLAFLAFAESGMHVLVVDSLYGPTRRFCDSVLKRMGVEVEYFRPDIGAEFEQLIKPNTGMVMLEAPASNSFEMIDIPLLASIAHSKVPNCVVMTDNTWATPLYFKPLDHGVDVSIHALTKYPAGHADVLMGSVSANQKYWPRLKSTASNLGICVGGDDAYLVLRGLRSMGVRLDRHQKSTMTVCKWLQEQNQVSQVLYPALPEDPGHELWKRDFCGATGLFSFVIKDRTREQCGAFLDALQIFGLGYSWAGYESLAVMPVLSDRTLAHGPKDGTAIRLQIGLEDPEDLINDISQGLEAVI